MSNTEKPKLLSLSGDRCLGQVEATIAIGEYCKLMKISINKNGGIVSLNGDNEFWKFSSSHVDASSNLCKILFDYFDNKEVEIPSEL